MHRFILILVASGFMLGCASYAGSNNQAAEAYVKLALTLTSQGYVKDAKEKLLMAESFSPRNCQVWCGNGVYYESVGEISKAATAYQQAIHFAPHDGLSHFRYGNFLLRTQEYGLAKEQFLLSLRDETFLEVASSYENIGICALNLGQKAMARDYFEKVRYYLPRNTKTF